MVMTVLATIKQKKKQTNKQTNKQTKQSEKREEMKSNDTQSWQLHDGCKERLHHIAKYFVQVYACFEVRKAP
jgi:hypothetical protein